MKIFNYFLFIFVYCTLSSCVDKDIESMKTLTLQAEQIDNSVILKWKPIISSRFKYYQIECANETGSFDVISDLKTNEFYNQSLSTYTVNPLPNRDSITYRVSALTTDGYFLLSNSVTVKIRKPYVFNEEILMIKPINNKIFALTVGNGVDSCYLKQFDFDSQVVEKSILLNIGNVRLSGSLFDMISNNNSEVICFTNNKLFVFDVNNLNLIDSIQIPHFPNSNGLHIYTDSGNQNILMVGNNQNTIYNRASKRIISHGAATYNFYSYDKSNNVFYGLIGYESIVKFTLNSDASTNIISTTSISTKTGFIASNFYRLIPNSDYCYLLNNNVMSIYDIMNDESFSIPTSNLISSNDNLYKMFYKGKYFYILSDNLICAYDINNLKFVKSFNAPCWERLIIHENYLYYSTTYSLNKQCFIGRVKLLD